MNDTTPVEEHDAQLARVAVRLGVAEHARAVRDGRPRRPAPGATSRDISSGRCWPSASSVTTTLGARVGHQPVAGAQRGAAAAVDHVPRDRGAVRARDVARAVARAVVDHQHRGLDAAHPLPGSAAAPGRCCPPRCRRGSRPRPGRGSAPAGPAVRNSSQAIPSSTARQLPVDPPGQRHVAQHQHEQHDDREHREAEDPPAAALAEREERSIESVSSVADTIASAIPASSSSTSTLRSVRRRQTAKPMISARRPGRSRGGRRDPWRRRRIPSSAGTARGAAGTARAAEPDALGVALVLRSPPSPSPAAMRRCMAA